MKKGYNFIAHLCFYIKSNYLHLTDSSQSSVFKAFLLGFVLKQPIKLRQWMDGWLLLLMLYFWKFNCSLVFRLWLFRPVPISCHFYIIKCKWLSLKWHSFGSWCKESLFLLQQVVPWSGHENEIIACMKFCMVLFYYHDCLSHLVEEY